MVWCFQQSAVIHECNHRNGLIDRWTY